MFLPDLLRDNELGKFVVYSWQGADLTNANLSGANLEGANLKVIVLQSSSCMSLFLVLCVLI